MAQARPLVPEPRSAIPWPRCGRPGTPRRSSPAARPRGASATDIDDRHARLVAQPLDDRAGSRPCGCRRARRAARPSAEGAARRAARGRSRRAASRRPKARAAGASSSWPMPSRSSDLRRDRRGARARGGEPAAEQQVLPHREMREEPPLLEDVADAAAVWRHEQSASRVDQRVAVERRCGRDRGGPGRRSMLTSEVLPEPERPKNAVSRPSADEARRRSSETPEPVRNVDREAHYAGHSLRCDPARQQFRRETARPSK